MLQSLSSYRQYWRWGIYKYLTHVRYFMVLFLRKITLPDWLSQSRDIDLTKGNAAPIFKNTYWCYLQLNCFFSLFSVSLSISANEYIRLFLIVVKNWLNDGFEWVFFVIPILLSFNRCDCVGTGFIRYELVELDKNGFIPIILGSNRYYFIIWSYRNI